MSDDSPAIDGATFRSVLGTVPTGVTVVASHDDGPVAMVIGSFGSVSLDPPLVQFMPAKTSTTWPRLERAGSFCVNILGADQLDLCNSFFSDGDPFEEMTWQPGATGSPVIDGCVSWIDCEIGDVFDAGDHWIVIGKVVELYAAETDESALVFYKGRYGRFSPLDAS